MGVELGLVVQERRLQLGWSRKDLAGAADVSYPYLSQIETGDREPSLRTLRKLGSALGISLEQLAGTPVGPADASRSLTPVRDSSDADHLALLRAHILPSIEKRLADLPPGMRIELLAELTLRAARALTNASNGDERGQS